MWTIFRILPIRFFLFFSRWLWSYLEPSNAPSSQEGSISFYRCGLLIHHFGFNPTSHSKPLPRVRPLSPNTADRAASGRPVRKWTRFGRMWRGRPTEHIWQSGNMDHFWPFLPKTILKVQLHVVKWVEKHHQVFKQERGSLTRKKKKSPALVCFITSKSWCCLSKYMFMCLTWL